MMRGWTVYYNNVANLENWSLRRQLRELVFALLDQLFAKPHGRIVNTGLSSTLLLRCFHILFHHTQSESSA